jgi:16S rRNA pseudouridine516 synthase
MMRLDKMLAHAGYGSRKEVKEYIRKGYVMVNGNIICDDDFKVDEINDEVVIADNNVNYEKMIYLLLNKPDGYVSATYDNFDPTVLDLIDGYEKRNIFPVGRLDKDTVGLLLITNDGDMAHKLLSPKKHVDKKYYLKYDGKTPKNVCELFENGITLDDGYKCMPAKFIDLGNNEAHIIIKEGKFHQVKRMMNEVGCEVTYLQRVEFGPLKLDDSLEEGEYRHLTESELATLKAI